MNLEDKPEVLFVAGSGEFGSGECQILDYLRTPEDKPFSAELIFPAEGRLVSQASEAGVPARVIKGHNYLTDFRELWRQPVAWVYNLSSFVRISAVIRKKKVQLVVSLSFINWTGALAARQEGVSHIWMIREVLSGRTNWLNFFWGRWLASRLANDLSVRVLLESSLAAEMFRRKRTRAKSLVLPPAIDARWSASGLTGDDRASPPAAVAMFFSGPDLKRIEEAVHALGQVVASTGGGAWPIKAVSVFFPGLSQARRRKLEDCLRRASTGNGLELEFPDFTDLQSRWKSFRAAVIFPGFDPLSRVVLEAGLAGIPVVVEKGAASELVIHGRTGFVFDYRDYAALGAFIQVVVKNPERGRQMGLSAREHVKKHYSLGTWKEQFEGILSEILFSSER
ncbi:MAG: glycosyltransferase family 4 protein [Candidatus Aminicenantes bacterium]|nr:glycosyltransferase family 4 protein [Candidatus Aminicenantes bacterium]